MIVCTEKDKEFETYKEKVNTIKVIFHIKDIFNDHWDNYKVKFANRNRRPIIDKVIDNFLLCKSFKLVYSLYEYPICHEEMVYYKSYYTRWRIFYET